MSISPISLGEGSNDDEGDGGNGGTLMLSGGFANGRALIDAGGDAVLRGGDSMVGSGGEVRISSGFSSSGSSGRTFLESAPSGPNGSSGDIGVYTGTSEAGTSGAIYIQTGSSTNAAGGLISLTSGNGGGLVDGGDITLTAGQTVSHAVVLVVSIPTSLFFCFF